VNDSQPFSRRTAARKLACDILYQMDLTGDDLEKVFESYRRMLEEGLEESGILSQEIPSFSRELVELYLENQEDINRLIASYADRWSLERMPMVDRNLLRLGFAELLYRGDIPTNVTINEYLELAKVFSTEDSGKFINGVMGKLVKERGLDKPEGPSG
jgi:N utilization substance protein B